MNKFDLDWLIKGYGFLLPLNKEVSGFDFAKIISSYYDTSAGGGLNWTAKMFARQIRGIEKKHGGTYNVRF